jgi:hypothetical protein
MLRGKLIAIRAYIKKTETSQINNLMIDLKLLEKQEQTKPKTSRQREIIKIRVKINEIKTKVNQAHSMKPALHSFQNPIKMQQCKSNRKCHYESPLLPI